MKNIFLSYIICTLFGFIVAKDADAKVKSLNTLPGWPVSTPFDMYSGYVHLKESSKAIHYFLVESENDPAKDPLIIWFNGGPGCSSMMGLLAEHGPYMMANNETTFKKNPYAWNKEASVLYVEQPAGVGFSYCSRANGAEDCHHNDDTSSVDNIQFLLQWYEKFPEFKRNALYVSGESYAGIYVPYLTRQIHLHNKKKGVKKVNLKGMLVGNGVTNWKHDTISAMMSTAYYRSIMDMETWDELNENNCTGKSYFDNWSKKCVHLYVAWRKSVMDVNIYNIYGKCYTKKNSATLNSSLSLAEVDGVPMEFQEELTADDYTPWVKWSMGARATAVGEGIATLSGEPEKEEMGIPPCTYAGPFVQLLNRKDVRQQLNIPKNFTSPWRLCTHSHGFKYNISAKGSEWIYKELKGSGIEVLKFSGDQDSVVATIGTENWINGMNWTESKEWTYYHLKDN